MSDIEDQSEFDLEQYFLDLIKQQINQFARYSYPYQPVAFIYTVLLTAIPIGINLLLITLPNGINAVREMIPQYILLDQYKDERHDKPDAIFTNFLSHSLIIIKAYENAMKKPWPSNLTKQSLLMVLHTTQTIALIPMLIVDLFLQALNFFARTMKLLLDGIILLIATSANIPLYWHDFISTKPDNNTQTTDLVDESLQIYRCV